MLQKPTDLERLAAEIETDDLNQLGKTTRAAIQASEQAALTMLEYARIAGEAQLKALNVLNNNHIKFGKWRKEWFPNYSTETLRTYMTVAEYWNNPDIKEKRKSGDITSIRQCMSAVRNLAERRVDPAGSLKAWLCEKVDTLQPNELEALASETEFVKRWWRKLVEKAVGRVTE